MKKQSQSRISDYKDFYDSVKSKPSTSSEERDNWLSPKRKKELEMLVTSVLSIPEIENEQSQREV